MLTPRGMIIVPSADFFVEDERAVRRVEILDDDVAAVQKNLGVMAGNRTVGNLKSIILHAADGGAFVNQLERAPGHALVQDNEFGHRLFDAIMGAAAFMSNANLKAAAFFQPRRSIIRRNSANNGVASCGPGEASG